MKILVAGIGNIFFGDDAFGCEVARELSRRPLPENVRVRDFGISGYDLAYAIMDGYDATILVDAVSRGQAPGTVYLIEPDPGIPGDAVEIANGHSLTPAGVLQMVRSMGGEPRGIYLVGCEPAVLETEDGEMGLSEIVQAAVPPALELIEKLIHDLLGQTTTTLPAPLVEAIER
jgi:hydrogenase maturation protease